MKVIRFTSFFTLLFFFAAPLFIVQAQQNVTKANIAISGYDVVSYHQSEPILGNSKYAVIYNGISFLFENAQNKDTFESNPEKYAPAYGGWCAYAMGLNGDKVSVDPESYTLEDGKLYLFYKSTFTDTRKKWLKNTPKLKAMADINWGKIIAQQ
ncbi:MAG: YHS domain protein [Flavobacteriales bacterium]|jgi:YHS domain-containing protein|nr:YHS domain protein [Flavobacteriales bacterium]